MPHTISPTKSDFAKFKKKIWAHYALHRRSFPWRERARNMSDAAWTYRVVVSEIMLQQTQASRVVAKFNSFVEKFPDFSTLARAPLSAVLREWQGLGYNRRGVNLKKLAEIIVEKYAGKVPRTKAELVELPNIGPHTAGSILAFAFNIAEPFVETNIRTVYIHSFFPEKYNPENPKDCSKVTDREILELVAATIDHKKPREWFFALMDYGVYLKQLARQERGHDPARRSQHYKKQSSFKGSNRELRAELLRSILEKPQTASELINHFQNASVKKGGGAVNPYRTHENILKNLAALEKEGFIKKDSRKISGKKQPASLIYMIEK